MIVSGEEQRVSAIHGHVSILPQTPLPSRLPHNIEQSCLCCTVGPFWLSILNTAVCLCPSQTPKLSLPVLGLKSSRRWGGWASHGPVPRFCVLRAKLLQKVIYTPLLPHLLPPPTHRELPAGPESRKRQAQFRAEPQVTSRGTSESSQDESQASSQSVGDCGYNSLIWGNLFHSNN